MMKNQKIPEVYLYVDTIDIAKWDYPFQFNNNIFTSTNSGVVKFKFLEGCQIYKIM